MDCNFTLVHLRNYSTFKVLNNLFVDIDLSVIIKSGDVEDDLNDTAESEACQHDPNNNTDFEDLNTAFSCVECNEDLNNTRFSDICKNGVMETCSYSCNEDLNNTRFSYDCKDENKTYDIDFRKVIYNYKRF